MTVHLYPEDIVALHDDTEEDLGGFDLHQDAITEAQSSTTRPRKALFSGALGPANMCDLIQRGTNSARKYKLGVGRPRPKRRASGRGGRGRPIKTASGIATSWGWAFVLRACSRVIRPDGSVVATRRELNRRVAELEQELRRLQADVDARRM